VIRAAIAIQQFSQTSTRKLILITPQTSRPILLYRNQFLFTTINALRYRIRTSLGARAADVFVQIRRTLYLIACVASDLLFESF
jgi:hypothetical protein